MMQIRKNRVRLSIDENSEFKVLQNNDQILAFSKVDPKLEKKDKMTTIRKIGVAPWN